MTVEITRLRLLLLQLRAIEERETVWSRGFLEIMIFLLFRIYAQLLNDYFK